MPLKYETEVFDVQRRTLLFSPKLNFNGLQLNYDVMIPYWKLNFFLCFRIISIITRILYTFWVQLLRRIILGMITLLIL